jgi:hypothetical protein
MIQLMANTNEPISIDKQTDRQTQRQTDIKHTNRHTDRQTDRQTDRHTDTHTMMELKGTASCTKLGPSLVKLASLASLLLCEDENSYGAAEKDFYC